MVKGGGGGLLGFLVIYIYIFLLSSLSLTIVNAAAPLPCIPLLIFLFKKSILASLAFVAPFFLLRKLSLVLLPLLLPPVAPAPTRLVLGSGTAITGGKVGTSSVA